MPWWLAVFDLPGPQAGPEAPDHFLLHQGHCSLKVSPTWGGKTNITSLLTAWALMGTTVPPAAVMWLSYSLQIVPGVPCSKKEILRQWPVNGCEGSKALQDPCHPSPTLYWGIFDSRKLRYIWQVKIVYIQGTKLDVLIYVYTEMIATIKLIHISRTSDCHFFFFFSYFCVWW